MTTTVTLADVRDSYLPEVVNLSHFGDGALHSWQGRAIWWVVIAFIIGGLGNVIFKKSKTMQRVAKGAGGLALSVGLVMFTASYCIHAIQKPDIDRIEDKGIMADGGTCSVNGHDMSCKDALPTDDGSMTTIKYTTKDGDKPQYYTFHRHDTKYEIYQGKLSQKQKQIVENCHSTLNQSDCLADYEQHKADIS